MPYFYRPQWRVLEFQHGCRQPLGWLRWQSPTSDEGQSDIWKRGEWSYLGLELAIPSLQQILLLLFELQKVSITYVAFFHSVYQPNDF
jgi:hypothetical protein